MVFSSPVFLLAFLPLALAIYYICPRKLRNGTLLLISLLFYGWAEPKYILIMLFSIALNYISGLLIGRFQLKEKHVITKTVLVLSIIGNLAILGFFKYTDFFIGSINAVTGLDFPLLNIALPIGISFYTFQTMSYTIDVYRGEVKAQKNIVNFAAYVTMFPQLIAGPIVRYKTVDAQLTQRRESTALFAYGVERFIIGLGKKVLLANRIGAVWDSISAMSAPTAVTAWLGAIAFMFQIYYDFSGYSDMAIGLGSMFGFRFLENFNFPYISKSITEFWHRWHISLSTWFKEYVYIPLGGNRKGLSRQLFNIALVWLLTGLWHGASWNFILWGAYFGLILILEKMFLLKLLKKVPAAVSHAYSLLLIVIGWVIFALPDMKAMGSYFASMLGKNGFFDKQSAYLLVTHAVLLILCAVFSTDVARRLFKKIPLNNTAKLTIKIIAAAAVLLLSIAFAVGDTYNPFLYFRF